VLWKHELERGTSQIEVEVRSSAHTLSVGKIRECLPSGVRTPKEAVMKELQDVLPA